MTAPVRTLEGAPSIGARLPHAGLPEDEPMVVPVVEIGESVARSDAAPERGRFSPADFSEPVVALLESELSRHADLVRLEAAGSVAEPAR